MNQENKSKLLEALAKEVKANESKITLSLMNMSLAILNSITASTKVSFAERITQ